MPPKKQPTSAAPAVVDANRMRGMDAPALPTAFEDVLPSGIKVKWRMPDPFRLIAFDTVIPDPTTQAVIRLLNEEKQATSEADPRKFRYDAQSIRGMYATVSAMLEEPKLDVSIEYGANGTLGRREIGIMDVAALYIQFRIATRGSPFEPTRADQPTRLEDAPPDSERVRDDASGADGD
jgi:hypothetical protein